MAELLVRWRVPLGWLLGGAALVYARPTTWGLAGGLLLSAIGESIRLWAAGHLQKTHGVTRSGPYRYSRNPLYLGSACLGAGFALASGRLVLLLVWLVFFLWVYRSVMRTEAMHLAEKYPSVYGPYAQRVPLFWPSLRPLAGSAPFRFTQLVKNREHKTALGVAGVYLVLLWRFAY